jgi:hypothetical protein
MSHCGQPAHPRTRLARCTRKRMHARPIGIGREKAANVIQLNVHSVEVHFYALTSLARLA